MPLTWQRLVRSNDTPPIHRCRSTRAFLQLVTGNPLCGLHPPSSYWDINSYTSFGRKRSNEGANLHQFSRDLCLSGSGRVPYGTRHDTIHRNTGSPRWSIRADRPWSYASSSFQRSDSVYYLPSPWSSHPQPTGSSNVSSSRVKTHALAIRYFSASSDTLTNEVVVHGTLPGVTIVIHLGHSLAASSVMWSSRFQTTSGISSIT